jgi:Ca2+-transporting ATPase
VILLSALFAGLPIPFLAPMILWNNLVTEGTITVNLAMDPREGDELSRAPRPRGESLVPTSALGRMALMSATLVAVTLGYFVLSLERGVPLALARTGAFTLLAVSEWFNTLNCRSEHRSALRMGAVGNRWLAAGLATSVLLQAAVIWFRPLGSFFGTVPLSAGEVAGLVALGSAVLWLEELRKWDARRRARGSAPRSAPAA